MVTVEALRAGRPGAHRRLIRRQGRRNELDISGAAERKGADARAGCDGLPQHTAA